LLRGEGDKDDSEDPRASYCCCSVVVDSPLSPDSLDVLALSKLSQVMIAGSGWCVGDAV
jgi:hypothetical protein